MSRVLCRMGCHALALSLVASWTFAPPPRPASRSTAAPPRPALRDRFSSAVGAGIAAHPSLRRLSTKLDMPIPASVDASRAPSPVQARAVEGLPEGGGGAEGVGAAGGEAKAEADGEGQTKFRAVLKEAKVAAQAPAEFSFDNFGF